MNLCPCCGSKGYLIMGAGDFVCENLECQMVWSVDKDGKVTVKE